MTYKFLASAAAVAATVGTLLVAPAAAQAAADVPPATARPGGAFYDTPTTFPAANGDLIRHEAMQVAYLGVPAQRIMYRSTDVNGKVVGVTGTVLNPTEPWRGGGPRPLVSFASGTIGQGDQCAPSLLFGEGLNYEALTIAPMLRAGVTVVMTDYIGLGTDGTHTYVNRVDEAHAVLDAARAAYQVGALRLPGVDVVAAAPLGMYGYSQGGGAVAAAAELAAGYAPELPIKGTASGAPPADLAKVAGQIDGTALVGAIGYVINGLLQDYPQIAAPLDARLNQRGKELLAAASTQCLPQTLLSGVQHTSSFTVDGRPVTAFLSQEPFASIVAAQRIGTLKPNAPVYIWNNANDDIVEPTQVGELAASWCRLGATVDYVHTDFPPIFPGYIIGHALPIVFGAPGAQQWLYQRLTGGGPSPSTC